MGFGLARFFRPFASAACSSRYPCPRGVQCGAFTLRRHRGLARQTEPAQFLGSRAVVYRFYRLPVRRSYSRRDEFADPILFPAVRVTRAEIHPCMAWYEREGVPSRPRREKTIPLHGVV